MPEIYVIRPTQRAADRRDVPNATAIVTDQCAIGFVGEVTRVEQCTQIIITDGAAYHRIAEITNVEGCAPMEGQVQPRVMVCFENARNLTPPELAALGTITWSSSNVRYLTLP